MKKFNDILNESNEGEFDNETAVDLIVKEYDYIKNTLFKLMKDIINKNLETVENISEDSFGSTVIKNSNGETVLKYLAVQFRIDENKLGDNDLADYFSSMKGSLKELFKLKDDAVKTGTGWYLKFAIDYVEFKNSNFYQSSKGVNKYNL